LFRYRERARAKLCWSGHEIFRLIFCEYNQHDRESELSNRPTEINELVWIRLTLLGRRNRRSARLDRRHLPGMPARCQVDPPKPRYLLPTRYGIASAAQNNPRRLQTAGQCGLDRAHVAPTGERFAGKEDGRASAARGDHSDQASQMKRTSAASWRKLDGQPAGLNFATTFGRNSLPDADFIGEEAIPNDPHQ